MQTIIIQLRNVYGATKAYPLCLNAERFSRIAGKKTLSDRDLLEVAALGFAIEVRGEHAPGLIRPDHTAAPRLAALHIQG